jgi:DUF1680 family protein
METSNHSNFIPLADITINDNFWTPFMERVRTTVIPYQWEALNDRIAGAEPSYCMRNFKIAAQMIHPELDYGVDKALGHWGFVFQDSDAAKWIEAAAYTLVWHPDPELEQTIDGAIGIICNAQQADGYLNTYYTINGIEKRFTNLKDNHELYCFGHFAEAAAAYYEATGKRKLLDACIRYADCIDRHIGAEAGKIHGYPGHEIAEMSLVRLYAITKNERHLMLARYFIDERGKPPQFFEEESRRNGGGVNLQYHQAHKPVREQRAATGHAVRAVYLYSGMADIARLCGDDALAEACSAIWDNIADRQMYITGAIGQSVHGEAFTFDYDLPNDTVYAETCAAIGLAFFARRMAAIAPRGRYGDVLERALYNGIISGMSLDGKSFFYVNPLEVIPESCLNDQSRRHVRIERQKWFGCACCPPNLARIIASLGSYIHSVSNDTIYTHLFVGGAARCAVNGGRVYFRTETRYPWESKINVFFEPEGAARFKYAFRVPSWCQQYSITLNGGAVEHSLMDGFALIDREWRSGDKLEIIFEMPAVLVEANPRVRENTGKTALMRGPLVYCLEEADNGPELFRIYAGQPQDLRAQHEPELLGGITSITFTGKIEQHWKDTTLYRSAAAAVFEDKFLKWIPYYAWANRQAGEMTVWVHRG